MVFDLKISAKHLEAQATRPPNGQACWRVGQARGRPEWQNARLGWDLFATFARRVIEQSLPCRHGCQTQAELTGHRGINGAPGLMQMQACNNSLSPWLASCVTVCRSRADRHGRACCLVPNSSLSQQLPPRCASHEKNHAACWLHFRRWFCSK